MGVRPLWCGSPLIRTRSSTTGIAMSIPFWSVWVGAGGRMRILRGCAVTADGYPVGAVGCVQAKDMKAPWCLCTSLKDVKAKSLLAKYAKRWGIGVSRQRARCHVGESPTEAKRLRLRSKGGAVARKQDGGALRQHARKECARSIRLQR